MPILKDILRQLVRDRTRAHNEVSRLDEAIVSITKLLGHSGAGARAGAGRRGRSRVSATGRARIAAAQRARWAKLKGEGSKTVRKPGKRVRTISAAARNRMAAAQRARWTKIRQQKKSAETKPQPEKKSA